MLTACRHKLSQRRLIGENGREKQPVLSTDCGETDNSQMQ